MLLLITYEGSSLYSSNPKQASRDQQLLWNHLQAAYQEEPPFNHQSFGSHLCPTATLRPKSVAVPGLTTSTSFSSSTLLSFLQEPQVRMKSDFYLRMYYFKFSILHDPAPTIIDFWLFNFNPFFSRAQ